MIPRQRTATADSWTLVARAQDGDLDAFADLWRIHYRGVVAYVDARLHSRETAEDIASEVFIAALRNIDRIRDQGHTFDAWLLTTARNRVIDHTRRFSNRLELPVADVADFDRPDPADVEGEVLHRADRDLLAQAMTALTPRQAQALRLGLAGLNTAEAAEAMHISTKGLCALTMRGRTALRPILAERLGDRPC